MIISDHAKSRLIERYDFTNNQEIKTIKALFFKQPHFKTIRINEDTTCIRQVKYKGCNIQAIVNPIKQVIITILPDGIEWDTWYPGFDLLCEKYRELAKRKKLIKTVKKFKKLIKIGKLFIGWEKVNND